MRLLSKPLTKPFEVDDPEYGKWSVEIAQATEGVYRELSDAQADSVLLYDEQGRFQGTKRHRNLRKLMLVLVYNTLVRTSGFVDDDGVEQFRCKDLGGNTRVKHAMSFSEFTAVWDLLPAEVADRIGKMAIEVNPTLDPNA